MTLNLLQAGEVAKIASVTADAALKARISGLGLRIGQEVAVIRRARMGGPLQIRVGSHRHINETRTGKPDQSRQITRHKHSFVIMANSISPPQLLNNFLKSVHS